MDFILQRAFHTKGIVEGDYTFGTLLDTTTQKFRSFVLEDTFNETKIKGETRFPAGKYKLKIRKEDTTLTLKHRKDYNKPGDEWFIYHIEITGIPNYSSVYIHGGNDDEHTLGCILPNYAFDLSLTNKQGSKSVVAVKAFYKLVYPLLEKGEDCWITVLDEITLK